MFLDVHNCANLGDNCISIMCMKIALVTNPDLIVRYHCLNKYHKELSTLVHHERFILIETECFTGYDLWVAKAINFSHLYHVTHAKNFIKVNIIRCNEVLEHIGANQIPMNESSIRFDFDSIKNSKYMNGEWTPTIAVVNSVPCSGQCEFDNEPFINLINRLLINGHRVLSTNYTGIVHENYKCSLDYDMTLGDIGAMCTNTEIIMGINTAPVLFMSHIWSIRKKYIICTRGFENCLFEEHPDVRFVSDCSEFDTVNI